MTFKADITVRVAGLTGCQILARLSGVLIRPLVTRQDGVDMAGLTLIILVGAMQHPAGSRRKTAPPLAVGLDAQIRRGEALMTLDAEFAFVTLVAETLVGAGGDRVGDAELGAMDVGHAVAELPHLVGPTGLVTFETEGLLLMTVGTVGLLHLGRRPVGQRPGHGMGRFVGQRRLGSEEQADTQ